MVLMLSLVLFLVLTATLYLLGVRVWLGSQTLIERVSGQNWQMQEAGHPSLSFREVLQKIGDVVPTSSKELRLVQRRLVRAGFRTPAAYKVFYGLKLGLALTLPLLTGFVTMRTELSGDDRILAIAAAAALGFFLPNQALQSMVKRRQKHLRKGLPNALDLMVVCVESGLGLDQAIMQVSQELQKAHPEISQELALVNLEMRHGKRRADALRNMAERAAVEDLKKLVAVLIQADRFGTSIAQSLRNHSDFMRTTARQDAETRAAKIGVKLVFPIFFCILPALFVVTVGPVIVKIMRDLIPLMRNG
jgi:tight adherence protein C